MEGKELIDGAWEEEQGETGAENSRVHTTVVAQTPSRQINEPDMV